jgi:uncharacterized protein
MDSSYAPRSADRVVAEMLREHPAILVVGPRATGKTTSCARVAATTHRMGNYREAAAMRADAASVLGAGVEPILIDEWQLAPETLGVIKERVDAQSRAGQFIVTGSVRGDLDLPTWPGTGRLVRLAMYGLTELEIEGRADAASWVERVATEGIHETTSSVDLRTYINRALRSGFPEPALRLRERGQQRWLTSYVDQLITRDAAEIESGRDPARLRRYLEAVTLNSAGIVDDVTLYEAARINKVTARAYDSLLQNLLVIDKIPAWTSNRLKRLVLAPKRYIVDPGLFTGVLGIETNDVLRDIDMVGRVLDTFVLSQLRAACALMPLPPRIYHLRSEQGRHEIDILIEVGTKLIAVEVKATMSPTAQDATHLRWLKEELGERVIAAVLLHTGPHSCELGPGIVGLPISALWT